MTAQTPPIFLQAGSHTAENVRRAFGSILGNRPGIVAAGHLAVSEKSGTPNMSVDVAEGQLVLKGSEGSYQGLYLCEARGVTNLAISAADATNPRRDLIVARVRDAAYSGATNTFSLEVVTGTPAGSPADPSLPSGSCFVLARVQVAASASSITNANITDLRTSYSIGQYGQAAALGGIIRCTNGTRPTGEEGLKIYEADTDVEYTYNGSAYVPTAVLGQWTPFTPTLTQSGAVTKTTTYARYYKVGRFVHVQVLLAATGSGTGGNAVTVSLPFTAAQAGNMGAGGGSIYDASTGASYPGRVVFNTTTTAALSPTNVTTGGYLGAATFTAALASGDSIDMEFRYEATS